VERFVSNSDTTTLKNKNFGWSNRIRRGGRLSGGFGGGQGWRGLACSCAEHLT